ncbi:hypothetical protein JYU34_002503 [Plutella xylostella]|uniref:Uncharacterized protein n=1 Tax=Plutella xylostella TaxID=51655 RepID=A0ABQ7R2E3_PLUXY|nr:hypothetical protein JYU34_002503 [Plutella xylostella]
MASFRRFPRGLPPPRRARRTPPRPVTQSEVNADLSNRLTSPTAAHPAAAVDGHYKESIHGQTKGTV